MENAIEKGPADYRKEFLSKFQELFNRIKEKVEKTDHDYSSIQSLRKAVESYAEDKVTLKEVNFSQEELQGIPSPEEMTELENKYRAIFIEHGYEEKNGYTQKL